VKSLLTVSVGIAFAIAGCSKKSEEKKEPAGSAAPAGSGSAAAGSGSAAEPPPEPVEAATVSGPTKSASGPLEFGGSITGTFEWKKKDQKKPISCAWDAKKEIGSAQVDVSDGAGKIFTLAVDVPPEDLGLPNLNVSGGTLTTPLKTSLGFKVSGDDEGHITVKFMETKLGADAKKPDLTINGTLEVTCPPKK